MSSTLFQIFKGLSRPSSTRLTMSPFSFYTTFQYTFQLFGMSNQPLHVHDAVMSQFHSHTTLGPFNCYIANLAVTNREIQGTVDLQFTLSESMVKRWACTKGSGRSAHLCSLTHLSLCSSAMHMDSVRSEKQCPEINCFIIECSIT